MSPPGISRPGTSRPGLVERVARVAHEANRTWDEVRGVTPGPPWDHAGEERRAAAMRSVKLSMAGAPPSQLHETWRAEKRAWGWKPGAVKDNQAKLDPMLVPYTELSSEDRRSPVLVDAITRALACGVERWAVKTLTDADAPQVNLTPQLWTVADLIELPAPVDPTTRVAQEFNSYQLSGTITLAKHEADSDIHMVIADGNGLTMIIEAPCPDCAQHSLVSDQIAAVREAVHSQFPAAADGGREVVSVPATVTGVAFFDRLHGQDGVAPNGIELHPLLSFVVGDGTPDVPGPPAGDVPGPPAGDLPGSPGDVPGPLPA